MKFLVKVRVDPATLGEFGKKLQSGDLDRSLIRGETVCLKADPAVGYSIWEAETRQQLDDTFDAWRRYYAEVEIREVIPPSEAARLMAQDLQG